MTIKTPAEIAADIYWGYTGDPETGQGVRQMIALGIEADRAQRAEGLKKKVEETLAKLVDAGVEVVAIDTDGAAVYEDETGERWNSGEHFLSKEAI